MSWVNALSAGRARDPENSSLVKHITSLETQIKQLEESSAIHGHAMEARAAAEREVLAINARLRHALADLSEREATIRQRAEQRRMLNEFARAVGSSQDIERSYALVIRYMEVATQCAWCAIATYDQINRTFRPVAAGGDLHQRLPARAFNEGMPEVGDAVGAALRSGVPFVLSHLPPRPITESAHPGGAGAQSGRSAATGQATVGGEPANTLPDLFKIFVGTGSLATVPVTVDEQVWGTLAIGYDVPDAVTEDRVEFLEELAAHLAVAIKNAQLYAELRGTLERLQSAQDQIVEQERLRALGQMASGIAHDLNNALAPVVGFAELLSLNAGALTASQQDWLRLIRTGASDASEVIRRLREFYRPQGQQEALTAVDLGALVEQVIALTSPKWKDQAQAAGRTITVESEIAPAAQAAGDAPALREALTNLVFNAVDAMPAGGTITLRVRRDDATSNTAGTRDASGQWVVLEVSDTGVGMDEATRLHCLEPFFTTKGADGSGMGLAMVYGILQRHGGTLEVESKPGYGSTFRLRLPAWREEGPESAGGKPVPVAAPVAVPVLGPRRRVLVVDDEPAVRQVTMAYLHADGHEASGASDAREAMELLAVNHYDVVIMDWAMPDMSGSELAKRISQSSPETRIILLTGFGELVTDNDTHMAGIGQVLSKPLRWERLRGALAG